VPVRQAPKPGIAVAFEHMPAKPPAALMQGSASKTTWPIQLAHLASWRTLRSLCRVMC